MDSNLNGLAQAFLHPNEKLIWAGKSTTSFVIQRGDWLKILLMTTYFLVFLFWSTFIFENMNVIGPVQFAFIFVVLLLNILITLIQKNRKRRSHLYVLTSHRALIINLKQGNFQGQIPISQLDSFDFEDHNGIVGSITFHRKDAGEVWGKIGKRMRWFIGMHRELPSFQYVPKAKHVKRKLTELVTEVKTQNSESHV